MPFLYEPSTFLSAGKSNIKDCLEFISEHLPHYGGEPVNRRGGFSAVVWNGDISLPVVIEISGHEKKEGIRHRFTYSLELVGGPTDYHIAKERFTAWAALPAEGARSKTEGELEEAGPAGRVLLEYPAEQGQTQFYAPSGKQSGGFGVPNSKQSFLWVVRDSSRHPFLGDFAKAVEGWGFYNCIPSLMRSPLPARKELRLQERGENLGPVLHSCHAEFPVSFREIEELLREAVPEATALLTGLTEAGQTYVFIEEQGLKTRIPSWAMSDGTLRFLSHLAVLYSPSPPALACFEEPENYLHPYLLELLANVLKKASGRTQILLTTHSPYLLNYVEPEDVLVVQKRHGETSVSRVEGDKGVKEALKTLGLGEMWYAGSLGGIP